MAHVVSEVEAVAEELILLQLRRPCRQCGVAFVEGEQCYNGLCYPCMVDGRMAKHTEAIAAKRASVRRGIQDDNEERTISAIEGVLDALEAFAQDAREYAAGLKLHHMHRYFMQDGEGCGL